MPITEQVYEKWLCLYTQPHREKLAQFALKKIGCEVYLPYRQKFVLRNRKRVPVKTPLFPRYLFIKAEDNENVLYGVHRQTGVSGFAAGTFAQSLISGDVINEIKARECPDGIAITQSRFIKVGQKVSVVGGSFGAIDAIFCEAKDEYRSILLLTMLGKTHRVLVSNKNLQLVA